MYNAGFVSGNWAVVLSGWFVIVDLIEVDWLISSSCSVVVFSSVLTSLLTSWSVYVVSDAVCQDIMGVVTSGEVVVRSSSAQASSRSRSSRFCEKWNQGER